MMYAWIMGHLNLVFLLCLTSVISIYLRTFALPRESDCPGNTPWSKYRVHWLFWTKSLFSLDIPSHSISPTVTQLPTAYSALDSFWLLLNLCWLYWVCGLPFQRSTFPLKVSNNMLRPMRYRGKSNMYSLSVCSSQLNMEGKKFLRGCYFSFGEMTITFVIEAHVHVELRNDTVIIIVTSLLNFKLHPPC